MPEQVAMLIGIFSSMYICTVLFAGRMLGISWREYFSIKKILILICLMPVAYWSEEKGMPYKLIFGICIYLAIIQLLYKCNFYKTLIITLFSYSLIQIVDIVTYWICLMLKIDESTASLQGDANAMLIVYFTFILVSIVFWYFLYSIRYHIYWVDFTISSINKKEVLQYFFLLLIVVAIIGYVMLKTNELGIEPIIPDILMAVFVVMNIKYFGNIKTLDEKKREFTELYVYTENIESTSLEKEKKRHERENRLIGLRALVRDCQYEEASKYIDEMLEDNTSECNVNLARIKNPIIKSVLIHKTNKAISAGIYIDIDICCDVLDVDVPNIQLNDMLSIILDNAIEAAQETDEKRIDILILEDIGDVLSITIANTCLENELKDDIYKYGSSTKGKGRGKGLTFLAEIEENNKNIEINTICTEGVFIQEIRILKKSEATAT